MAVLTAAVLAVTTLLVPATAHADVTKVNLSVAFDRLSADRVATITLEAASESGITEVEAVVEHLAYNEWTPIGTVPLVLADGTANDGTWRAEYRTDIEARPGTTRFTVEIRSADGATRTESDRIDNCYRTVITDLATTPDVVDADTPMTVAGRVQLQKTRDTGLEPAANVSVGTKHASVRTEADGSFAITHPYKSAGSLEVAVGDRDEWLCETSEVAPSPEITRQSVELSAEIVTPQPVRLGDQVVVTGRLLRNGADGPVPVHGAGIEVYQEYGSHREKVASGVTHVQEPFRLEFTAGRSGRLIVVSPQTDLLEQGSVSPGTVEVLRDARITDFEVAPSPVGFREPIKATGWLEYTDQDVPIGDGRVALEFSSTGESWSEVRSGRTNTGGRFELSTSETTESGYWRVRYTSADGETSAVSGLRHVGIEFGTRIDDFAAEAAPGGTVTARGTLVRLKDEPEPLGGIPVHVYFLPDGESSWVLKGSTSTGADGKFEKEFPADRNGSWTAWYWGDDRHRRSNSSVVHVDVLGKYTTEFTEFGATPATVPSGEAITVAGLLGRSVGGGTPEPAPDKPVYIYFLPAGGQEWQQKALVRTGADGRFAKAFTAERDGYWTAWFYGDEGHLSINSGSKRVDVQ